MGIRSWLIIAILPVVAAVTLFYAIYLIDKERQVALADLRSSISRTDRLLEAVVADPLYDGNVEQLGGVVDSFFGDRHMVQLALEEYDGSIRIDRERAPADGLGTTIPSRVVVMRGRDALGEVRTVYSTALLEAELLRSRNRILLYSAALISLLSGVIYLVTRFLTRPLDRLNVAARAIADGQLDQPLEARGAREIASLGESFLRMREAVRSRMADLAERNEELRREFAERQKLASVVEASADFMGVATPSGEVQYVNGAGRALVGLGSLDEAARLRVADLVGAEDRAELEGIVQAVAGRGSWVGEFRLRHAGTGAPIPVDMNAFRISDSETGRTIAIATVCRDITERKKAEDETRRLQAQLTQSQKMEAVGRLAGGVAHDFNNLLTVINGHAHLLLGTAGLPAEAREGLELISEAGESAAALTRQLLAFSRKQMLQPKLLDLNALVGNMNRMLTRVIGEDVKLMTRLGEGLWRVRIDPGQVEQVIMNLVVNSRDAMPEGGTVTIETGNVVLDEADTRSHPDAQPGPYVMLAVSDSGAGMDAETQKRIFEPFFSTKGQRGTGLGLSTVYGIVKQSGGHVSVYSERGMGATFQVYLPRRAGEDEAEEVAAQRLPAASLGETVLVAEDSDGVRHLVRQVLGQVGYRVLEARDGDEAVRLAGQHPGPIHLLLTDVVMPGQGGRVAAERLKGLRPGMRVIYMSGYTEDAILTKSVLESGADFLEKPFTPAALQEKVKDVLGRGARAP